MLNLLTYMAHASETYPEAAAAATQAAEATHQASESAGGIAALGLNWQSFLFQLITFVIVLLILRKFVFGKLIAVLDARQKAVDDSLKNAAETEEKMKNAEKVIAGMLVEARNEADSIIAATQKEAARMVEAAEAKAAKRAEQIVKDAQSQMQVEVSKAREELKAETVQLVAQAAEKIIGEKLDASKDAALIKSAINTAKERADG